MKVMMGERELELGGRYLGTLRDATDLRHDVECPACPVEGKVTS